ncbi:MAG: penicillin-binding protein 1C [Marinicaulis sp.]|nr:penicillin-binding protein 1C [Marinicaulis sp.]
MIVALIALDVLFPPPLSRADDVSSIVLDRNGQWLNAFTTDEGRWRFSVDLDDVAPEFVERLIAVEDKRFYSHPGVDLLAVGRAAKDAASAGRFVSGASTITMQTVRLLEPRPRTLPSKFIEMVRAFQIERRLSKREILELYLTLAPYGGNIEGVRAASLLYFDKEPTHLTDAEQALLIALPQAPEARRPDLRAGAAKRARAAILEKLISDEFVSEKHAREATEDQLPNSRAALPRHGYHAADFVARRHGGGETISTLDTQIQLRAEEMLSAHVAQFDDKPTGALMIIDNETREVRASVGSSGLDAKGGWIDLTGAVRSPGSTLKPFIYALAFEDGLANASTLIDDMPRSFGDYTPENFDKTFRGEVQVREALQHSLNLPAVAALDRIGVNRFFSSLKIAGIDLRTPNRAEKREGLALALGGAGVTMREIAALYAALGDGGAVKPVAWRAGDKNKDAKFQLVSENTANRVSAILAEAPALAGRAPAELSSSAMKVAFKTGTSYGYRDAWAAGHGGGYTVVVWVGHASGETRPGWTGRKAAAPLLFEIFDMLEQNGAVKDSEIKIPVEEPALAMARLDRVDDHAPPQIIFPRDGVELFAGGDRGFALAARGGASDYRWYVNGEPVTQSATARRTIWRPSRAGFYEVTVVDAAGAASKSKVRVASVQ